MENLLRQALEGDEKAEKQIFEYLFVRFRVFAKRIVRERQDAEDIAQEACITVLEKYKTQSFTTGFESWAYGVLRMKIGNHLQKKKNRRISHYSDAVDAGKTGYSSSNPDEDLHLRISDCARKIITTYPRYARVLNLIYQGFKVEEICERLETAPNNLYVILNRGRSIMKQCLETGRI